MCGNLWCVGIRTEEVVENVKRLGAKSASKERNGWKSDAFFVDLTVKI